MSDCTHRPAYLHYLFPRRSGEWQPFVCKHCGKPIRASYSKHLWLELIPVALLVLLWLSRALTGFPTLAVILALCVIYSVVSWRFTTFYPLDDDPPADRAKEK